ncbi:glucose-6-phosphate dehydrogenase [Halothermothrix orenii]|uniref:Glucose-6-phosphate 1-dehydrogenase n=1 Tax=Halothermothrix orenii (strain H 168 / OCM 544 / DSM 9562) TaxID=373903 RepID=B8CYK7_HALOH|nr:glucose-6-phosphate dehydrogenase [Halothermothrix orenii]ACL70376.1 glucose-6-phosphate 1-dehydrogenase [Halothermothrix orenii H 168]
MKRKNNELEPCQIIIFGGTGDLTHRKLMPALYNLQAQGLLPDNAPIISIGRRDKNNEIYRDEIYHSINKYSRNEVEDSVWSSLSSRIFYQRFDFREDEGYSRFKNFLCQNQREYQTGGNRIFYLAVAPEYFGIIVDKLKEFNIVNQGGSGWNRVVIEKPFGHDLDSARKLNDKITAVFNEENTYRIDHYLGKEMLQNIMTIRFANTIFEPVWNNRYIDNIQIVSSESAGVGRRGGYYEQAGALKDMVQNHMLQLLTLTAMEPPATLDTESIRDEKVKVLKALLEMDTADIRKFAVRGQYGPGKIKGRRVPGYRDEERTDPDSKTETFVALKVYINNIRWSGVPFYIKTGKRLQKKSTEVIIEFKDMLHPIYLKNFNSINPNLLVIRIQPREGVYFRFNTKKPGTRQTIIPVNMDFCQNCQIGQNSPEAYERLLQDVILGDQTLFTRWDEVEYSWSFIDKIAEAWQDNNPDFPNYHAGSQGPIAAEKMLQQEGHHWWNV